MKLDANDWPDDPETRAWIRHVRTDLVPKLHQTSMTLSIIPDDPEKVDIKFAVELGLSIMLDKPIICIVNPGTIVPRQLQRVAAAVIVGDPRDPNVRAELMDAMRRVGGSDE